MAKKNLLESLIHSLNPSELKRFALYTKTYTSNKSYLDLFKAIKNNVHKSQKYDNKYAQKKRYLYRIILESLILKDKKTIKNEVLFLIKSANYLINKQMPDHAYQQVNKALALVTKHEMTGYHLEIIEIEKQIRVCMNPKGYRSDEEILQEEVYLIEQQKQLQSLKAVYNHILNYKKKYGYIDYKRWDELYTEILEMGFPNLEDDCINNRAIYYYNYNQCLLSWIKHSHKEAYKYTTKLIQMDPAPLNNLERLNAYLEHSSSCFCLGRTHEIIQTLNQVEDMYQKGAFGRYDSIALKIFYYRSNYELLSYVFMGDEKKLRYKLVEIEKGMEYWGDKIPFAMKMIVATGLKFGYLAVGDLKKMKKQINFLIDSKKSGLRQDAYEDGLVWNMIYYFIKDDIDFLEIQAERAYKHFSQNDVNQSIDSHFKVKISKLFWDYSRMRMDKKQFLNTFKEMLEEKMVFFDNNFSEIDYPFLLWVQSEISGKPLLDTAYEMSDKYLNK